MNITLLGLVDIIDPLREFGAGARKMRLRTVHIREFESEEEKHPASIPVEFWNQYAEAFDKGGYSTGETVQVDAKLTASAKGYAAVRARGISRPATTNDAPAEPSDENPPDGEMPF